MRTKQKNSFPIIFLVAIMSTFCLSCKNNQNTDDNFFKISRTTFTDELSADGTVMAIRSTTLSCPSRIEGTILFLVEDGSIIEEGDTVCILENRELSNNYEQLVQRVEQTKAEYSKSEANLNLEYALLEAQVKNNEAQTSITYLDSAQLQYASPRQQKITRLEIERAKLEKKLYENKLGLLKTINEFELKKLRLQIARDENRAAAIKALLGQLCIISPKPGLVLRADSPFNGKKLVEGDNVWNGIGIAIMPDLSEMKVVMKVPESDYKRIKVNDKVSYSFNSNPSNKASGKITVKAPVGIPVSNNSKVKLFEITASVDSFSVIPEPGISATCTIMLSENTNSLVVPQLAIFDEDSSKFVYIKRKHNFEKREIFLGENTPKKAIVIAGINENEMVSYTRPPETKISSTTYLPDTLKNRLRGNTTIQSTEIQNPTNSIYSNQNKRLTK